MLGAFPARAEGDAGASSTSTDGGTDARAPVPDGRAPVPDGSAPVPDARAPVPDTASAAPIGDGGADLESPVSAAAPAPLSGAAPAPLGETTVRTRRRDSGQTTLSPADVRNMPGAFGDPFRAIEALPGITPVVSGLPYFYIRGAPPNDNGYYVDGIRVPLLFHLGIGQGVIHPGLIDRVDFFPGAPPARYGGVVGAIVAGQTRDPAPARRGEANLRLFDAGGLLESPLGGNRGSVLVAGRYGYPGPILGAITPGLDLSYWDYQARASWRLSDRDTLGMFAFGSHDHLSTPSPSGDPAAQPIEQFLSDFHRVDLRYDHALARGQVRLALTGGRDRQGAAPTYITDSSAGVRLEVQGRVAVPMRVRAGASLRLDAYGFEQGPTRPGDPPVPSTADPPPTNLTSSAHADVVWVLGPRIELTPGLRFDLFASSRASAPGAVTRVRTTVPAFDPRLSARVTIAPAFAWIATFGTSHQYPALRVGSLPAPVVTVPGFPIGERQPQVALQTSQGIEIGLPADIVVTGTGFLSRWSGLTDVTAMCVQTSDGGSMPGEVPRYRCPDSRPVSGHAYGLELLARRPLSRRVSGWLSYTLSRSIRDAHFINASGGDDHVTVPSDADRTHVVNALIAWEIGRRWRLGARGLFYTGMPYSRLDGVVPVPPYNAYRTPSFLRFDIRLEKRWALGRDASIALVVEGQNVTLSRETSSFGLDCMDSPTMATQCTQGRIGPITIPSVGVEAFF
jgi:hypothetical protein